jgi:tetratricopeptide (TPR) repeat protein
VSATFKKPGLVASLALALAACATGGGAARESKSAATSPASSARPAAGEGAARATAGRELSPRAQRLFDEAVATADQQKRLKVPPDWETLERRWRAVIEAESVPEAWFNLGVVLDKCRRPDDARAAYRRALELEPGLAAAAVNLALLDEPKDPHQAAQTWTALMRRFPDDPMPRARLAAIYLEAGQRDEAWKLAREALVRDPRAVGAYKIMMKVALERGNADLAQLLALKARKLDDADPEIVAFVGEVLLRQKDEPGAVAQWKKAITLKDDFLPARYALLGNALGKQHWDGVAEQARAILRTDPDEPRVQLALGVAYRYLGQADKALAAYDQAERLGAGRLPEVHLARSVTLMKSKDQCEPALAELKRYLAAVGPGVASEGPAMRLERECEQILAANRQAEEASREMKAQAEREAARKAAPTEVKPTSAPAPAQRPANGAEPPAGVQPAEAAPDDEGRAAPTK